MIKPDNYINIQGWMVSELNLKGNDLLIYAIIHGFSQDGTTRFTGGLKYLAEWCNSTKQGVQKNLKNLLDSGLIEKYETEINGVKFCEYSCIPYNKVAWGMQQSCTNNTSNTKENKKSIISKDINTVENSFLGSIQKQPAKQSLYSKACALILAFTEDEKLRSALIEFLNLQLEIYKSKGKTFYINIFKNRLNKLKENFDSSTWLDVVNYAVSKGYQNFYPIPPQRTYKTDIPHNESYDEEYAERQLEWRKEMERNGKRTAF